MSENLDIVELQIPTTSFRSPGDKESFFRWLYTIDGYVSCVGKGTTIYVTLNIRKVDRAAAQELFALFKRYDAPNMSQLAVLKGCKAGKWFADPDKYWHVEVFARE